MVESKLESLVQRLEAAVARQEALAAAGGGGAPAASAGVKMCKLAREYVAEVSPALDDLKAKSGDLGNKYVDELVATLTQIVVMQVPVLNTMAQYKKPEDVQFLIAAVQQAY